LGDFGQLGVTPERKILVNQVSAVIDQPRDALFHDQSVVNNGGRSVWLNHVDDTGNGRRVIANKQKIGDVQSWYRLPGISTLIFDDTQIPLQHIVG